MPLSAKAKRLGLEVNYKNWAENAVSFIREKNLTSEFTDWCGGWPAPIDTAARPTPQPHTVATYEALAFLLDIVSDLHETGKTSETRLELLQQAVRRFHSAAISAAPQRRLNPTPERSDGHR